MHEFLRPAIRAGLQDLLGRDNDEALHDYQFKAEAEIGKRLGKGYAVGTTSGTAALQFSLLSLGIGPGDEVITVPNTYIATALAISNTGAKPVFCDIAKDLLVDTRAIEEKITHRTKAIIPVHLYGQMADMHRLSSIAKKHSLHVIEDAAHSQLAKCRGRLPGTQSDSACYSFHPSKGLGGISNGGMIISSSRSIRNNARLLRNPTSGARLLLRSHRTPGYLDWIQAVFIKAKLSHMKKWIARRREIAARYNEAFEGYVGLPVVHRHSFHVYRDYVIIPDKRDRLAKQLRRRGIETVVHYSQPLHLTELYPEKKGKYPVAEDACRRVLSLPVNPFLCDGEVEYVIKSVRSCL